MLTSELDPSTAVVSSTASSLFASISVPSQTPLVPSSLPQDILLEDDSASDDSPPEDTLFRKSFDPVVAPVTKEKHALKVRPSSALSAFLLSSSRAASLFLFSDQLVSFSGQIRGTLCRSLASDPKHLRPIFTSQGRSCLPSSELQASSR